MGIVDGDDGSGRFGHVVPLLGDPNDPSSLKPDPNFKESACANDTDCMFRAVAHALSSRVKPPDNEKFKSGSANRGGGVDYVKKACASMVSQKPQVFQNLVKQQATDTHTMKNVYGILTNGERQSAVGEDDDVNDDANVVLVGNGPAPETDQQTGQTSPNPTVANLSTAPEASGSNTAPPSSETGTPNRTLSGMANNKEALKITQQAATDEQQGGVVAAAASAGTHQEDGTSAEKRCEERSKLVDALVRANNADYKSYPKPEAAKREAIDEEMEKLKKAFNGKTKELQKFVDEDANGRPPSESQFLKRQVETAFVEGPRKVKIRGTEKTVGRADKLIPAGEPLPKDESKQRAQMRKLRDEEIIIAPDLTGTTLKGASQATAKHAFDHHQRNLEHLVDSVRGSDDRVWKDRSDKPPIKLKVGKALGNPGGSGPGLAKELYNFKHDPPDGGNDEDKDMTAAKNVAKKLVEQDKDGQRHPEKNGQPDFLAMDERLDEITLQAYYDAIGNSEHFKDNTAGAVSAAHTGAGAGINADDNEEFGSEIDDQAKENQAKEKNAPEMIPENYEKNGQQLSRRGSYYVADKEKNGRVVVNERRMKDCQMILLPFFMKKTNDNLTDKVSTEGFNSIVGKDQFYMKHIEDFAAEKDLDGNLLNNKQIALRLQEKMITNKNILTNIPNKGLPKNGQPFDAGKRLQYFGQQAYVSKLSKELQENRLSATKLNKNLQKKLDLNDRGEPTECPLLK